MKRMISVVPAYGRDYTTEEEVLAAWEEGRDFLIQDIYRSGYVSKYDKPDDIELKIRYNRWAEIVVIP